MRDSYGNAWPILTFLRPAVGRWGYVSPLALVLRRKKNPAVSTSSTVHGDQYNTKYVTFE